MGRHRTELAFAVNYAKQRLKNADTETERRWWFTRYIVLAKLVTPTREVTAGTLQPTNELDNQVDAMMKKLELGGDNGNDAAPATNAA